MLPLLGDLKESLMNRRLKAALASVAVAVALLSTGGTGAAVVADARGPLICC